MSILDLSYFAAGCNCGAANCPWTQQQQSSGCNANPSVAAPVESPAADKKHKSIGQKAWAGAVRKTEVASGSSWSRGYGSGAPGRMTPGQEMKPATHVKQEPTSPGASVGNQSNVYNNLKGLPPPGNGKRETLGTNDQSGALVTFLLIIMSIYPKGNAIIQPINP